LGGGRDQVSGPSTARPILRGVGRNDHHLSADMKAAVVAAREDGMPPAEIVETAAAGPEPGATPLLTRLLREASESQSDDASELETRRHELSNRWVRATVRHVRAEHPDWPAVKVANAARGRPQRINHDWKVACGHDPAGARDHVPPRASPRRSASSPTCSTERTPN
jgi:hypothetical protein